MPADAVQATVGRGGRMQYQVAGNSAAATYFVVQWYVHAEATWNGSRAELCCFTGGSRR
jgi:hypothetical protein